AVTTSDRCRVKSRPDPGTRRLKGAASRAGRRRLRAIRELNRAARRQPSRAAGPQHAHPLLVGAVEASSAATPVAPAGEQPPVGEPGEGHLMVLVCLALGI